MNSAGQSVLISSEQAWSMVMDMADQLRTVEQGLELRQLTEATREECALFMVVALAGEVLELQREVVRLRRQHTVEPQGLPALGSSIPTELHSAA